MGQTGGSVRWSRLAKGNVRPDHVQLPPFMIDEMSSVDTARVNPNDLCCYVRSADKPRYLATRYGPSDGLNHGEPGSDQI
jgi:hypothetical protein